MMDRRSGVVHAIGGCRNCEAEFTNWKNALALAAKHAKATGHTTWAEQCISVEYGPRTEA